jgi:hypothetical protein
MQRDGTMLIHWSLDRTDDVVQQSEGLVHKANAVPAAGEMEIICFLFMLSSHGLINYLVLRWCGVGTQFCKAPTCQVDYGPACDANIRPKGADTAGVPRPKLGNVPYGRGIYTCTVRGTVALTFDDGPWTYTEHLLDMLAVC